MKTRIHLAGIFAALVSTGSSFAATPIPSTCSAGPTVTAEQALVIFKSNIPAMRKRVDPSALPTVFVDPRKPSDYERAHIPGAINLPIEEDKFDKTSLWKVTKNSAKPVVFYCNGENCPRSHLACETARNLGYRGKVYYFYTGMGPNGWPRINGPTVSGPQPYSSDR